MKPSLTATKLHKIQAELEYVDLYFIDIEIMDREWKDWNVTRGLLDIGSQGSCINKALSTNALTDYRKKTTPMTIIMADRHDLPTGPITQYNPDKILIVEHEEQLTIDTASLSHLIILEMTWCKRYNPKIDYSGNTMTFNSHYCNENCSYYSIAISLHPKNETRPES